MFDPTTLVVIFFVVVILLALALYFTPKPVPKAKPYENFSDLAKRTTFSPEVEAVIDSINLPEEKFAKTREEILAQAQVYSQEYVIKHPETPYITADFINQLLVLNNLPALGKYASGFFRNKKLFASTELIVRSNYPPSRGRTIKVYRYVGPLVSTAIN